jgi:hypothetical protein
MRNKSGSKTPKTSKTSKSKVKDLRPDRSDQVQGGRIQAQLNSRSVNPIVISRDRALNS